MISLKGWILIVTTPKQTAENSPSKAGFIVF